VVRHSHSTRLAASVAKDLWTFEHKDRGLIEDSLFFQVLSGFEARDGELTKIARDLGSSSSGPIYYLLVSFWLGWFRWAVKGRSGWLVVRKGMGWDDV
jgi:hypothetical protein